MALSIPQYFSRFGQCELIDIGEHELDTSKLHTRVVQSPTRETLLSSHHPFHLSVLEESSEATALLSNLNRLAPSVAKDFVPKHYAESSIPLRLLNDLDFLGQETGYIALSYCRNKNGPGTPRKVVTPLGALPFGWTKEVESFPLPTSSAVFQAVLRERRLGEGLWFDQVCINQEDENEKVVAIGAIDAIYKNARTVVVALDDITATPDEEQFLRYYVEQYSYSELPPDQQPNRGLSPPLMSQHPILWSFLERILSSAWFDRAWCAYEMRMGQSHIFILPCYSQYEGEIPTIIRFTGAFFLHLLVLASEVYSTAPTTYHRKIRSLLDFFHRRIVLKEDTIQAARRPDTPQMPASDHVNFVSTLTEIFQMQAGGNPRLPEYLRRLDANRDKMGIALNASGLPLATTSTNPLSRPNIEDECLRSLLLVGIAARDPVALCTTGTPLRLHDGSISWLSRPTPLDSNPARPAPLRFPSGASQITQSSDGRAEYAQLDLLFLELPHRTHPNPNFSTQVSRARSLIDLCIQYQLGGHAVWDFWQVTGHERGVTMRNIFIQTLACVFECGENWLREQQSSLPPTESVMTPHTIDMLFNPHLIFQNFIALPEGQASVSRLLNLISTLVASGIPWASGATERNYGPMIITAPTAKLPFGEQPSSPTSLGGKAIIFAPFEHSKTLLIAVPDAVKDTNYNCLARGWILTSMNPFTGSPKHVVSWTLQSKGIIFGDRNFHTGLERCGEQDVRNHRVYGPAVQ
ncbi:heterokaryon incompatibility protein-domain-containing protein [Phaeosphaeriaceae sp. PMI808]|nr:heterokaryon incompatibility protein-domain-containing protein [Phaeosphaeriaceae sp. PMI808]